MKWKVYIENRDGSVRWEIWEGSREEARAWIEYPGILSVVQYRGL